MRVLVASTNLLSGSSEGKRALRLSSCVLRAYEKRKHAEVEFVKVYVREHACLCVCSAVQ